MKKIFGLIISLLISNFTISQTLLQDTIIDYLSEDVLMTIYTEYGIPEFFSPIEYSLELYRIVYRTIGVQRDSVIASGAMFIPIGLECTTSILS